MTLYEGNIYVADWSNSDVMKVSATGSRSELISLKSPPFGISAVVDGVLYVTQLQTGSITQINIGTGQAAKLPLNCPDLKIPFGIVVLDKSMLLVSDARMQQIDYINLVSKTYKKIASIPTTAREQA